jgi:hypothetical protein
MFTLARKAITSLVVSCGLCAWFDVKKGRCSVVRPEKGACKILAWVRVDE